jgi:hypothetical protein
VEEETDDAEEVKQDETVAAAVSSNNTDVDVDVTAVTISSAGQQPATLPQEEPPSVPRKDDKQLETLVQHLQVTTINSVNGKEDVDVRPAEEKGEAKKESKGKWLGVW